MQFKGVVSLLVILLSAVLSNAVVCRTQEGVAWCEASSAKCYYKAGGQFNRSYCNTGSLRADGQQRFNGANCRKCPSTYCDIVTRTYHGTLLYFNSYNNYRLTRLGWCYAGN